jgi:hypothetical protein
MRCSVAQRAADCLHDGEHGDPYLSCNITQRTVLILLLSLGLSAVLLGYKLSHLPQLRTIWSKKRELNWKRQLLASNIHSTEELPITLQTPRSPRRPLRLNVATPKSMRDATEMASIKYVESATEPHAPLLPASGAADECPDVDADRVPDQSLYGVC